MNQSGEAILLLSLQLMISTVGSPKPLRAILRFPRITGPFWGFQQERLPYFGVNIWDPGIAESVRFLKKVATFSMGYAASKAVKGGEASQAQTE